MAFNSGELGLPDDFDNVVRLFPLPNLVLFPGVVQALHIFEPRYREMTADALEDDQLITMAYVQPDWESEFSNQPAIATTVCIGKIISHTKMADGRYNLFLVGTKRAKVVEELAVQTPYRMAEIEVIEDDPNLQFDSVVLRHQIIREFRKLAALQASWNHEALDQFLDDALPLSQLIDMIGYATGVDAALQQKLLETLKVDRRGELLLQIIRQLILEKSAEDDRPTFPPPFSLN